MRWGRCDGLRKVVGRVGGEKKIYNKGAGEQTSGWWRSVDAGP